MLDLMQFYKFLWYLKAGYKKNAGWKNFNKKQEYILPLFLN